MLTDEQKAGAINMAMSFEMSGFNKSWMAIFIKSLNQSPKENVNALLEFLRTSSPATARFYNEIMFYYTNGHIEERGKITY